MVMSKIDAFWAEYFGCSAEDLNAPRTLVVPHAALRGHDGILVFRHGPACIISVPQAVSEGNREKLRGASPDRAFNPEVLAKSFMVWQDWVLPPAWVGVCEPGDFTPVPSPARMLTSLDAEAIRRLAERSGEVAWHASELRLDCEPNFGAFSGEELVAISGYLNMGGVLAYIGVVTHPEHRGKGYAKAAASACMQAAFDQNLVPMWRTPVANAGAVAVARSLGFRPYARTIDVPLTAPEF